MAGSAGFLAKVRREEMVLQVKGVVNESKAICEVIGAKKSLTLRLRKKRRCKSCQHG